MAPPQASSFPDLEAELEAPPPDLGGRAVRSGFIQLGGQAALSLLAFGSMVALARLLTPADYGLVAMAYSLTAFVGTFRDLGLPMATVHREGLDHRQVSALFWIALGLNVLIGLFLIGMAPALAWLYGQPKLIAIVPVLAVGVFAMGIAAQSQSLLVRQMRFGRLTLIDLGAMLAGIAAGIGFALGGAGYWALVLQTVVFNVTRSAAIWQTSKWRPTRKVGWSQTMPAVRSLLSYGGHYTGFLVLGHLSRHLDRVLIGYFGGPTSLGLYDNAHKWSHSPQTYIYPPLLGVAVSSLSRKQRDPEGYRSACRKGFLPVLTLLMPVLAFMAVEARSVILVLFGERWLEAVPIFRLLCIAGFAGGTSRLTTWLFLSQGETKRQFQWALRYAPVMVIAVAIGIQWGALGVAVAVMLADWLLAYPRIAFCLQTSPLGVREFLKITARPAVASIGAAAVLLAAQQLFPTGGSPVVELAIGLGVFALAYCLAWLLAPGGRHAAAELLRIFAESWGAREGKRAQALWSRLAPTPPPAPPRAR